ncbi:MAG: NnrU family protein [Burkholderiales bacterium]
MLLFIVGLVIFLGIHSVAIVSPAWREAQIAQRGEKAWKGLYSIVSIGGFALLIYGYGLARGSPVVLYTPPTMLRHIALLLMVPVFPLLFAAYLPGRIKTAAKHPMLLAVKLWATAHLLANGTRADVVLFGAFLVWAVADRISVKRRPADERHAVPGAPPRAINDVIVLVVGLVIYAAFLAGVHRWLFGVSPLR